MMGDLEVGRLRGEMCRKRRPWRGERKAGRGKLDDEAMKMMACHVV